MKFKYEARVLRVFEVLRIGIFYRHPTHLICMDAEPGVLNNRVHNNHTYNRGRLFEGIAIEPKVTPIGCRLFGPWVNSSAGK